MLKHKYLKSAAALAIIASLSACNGNDEEPPLIGACDASDSCVKFTIMHTNDNHGRFWENDKGEYGMAARKTLIESIRKEVESNGGYSLLLSGGDINTGVPESDLLDAEPDFKGMNLLGYDAMAVGNHEFDNELSIMDLQRDWSYFPWLAANIYKNENGERVRYFDAYKIFEFGSLRIAVIGLITEDTKTIGNPDIVGSLEFTDPKTEIQDVIAEIKTNKSADLIFATTHMGHYENGNHGSNAPGDVALAKSVESGVLQAIFGGHSQNPVCMEPGTNDYADFKPGDDCVPDQHNGTYIMQAHEWGKYVGRADFEFYDGELHMVSYQLIPVNLKQKNDADEYVFVGDKIEPDQVVYNFLKPFKDAGGDKLDEVIAVTEVDLPQERGKQTQLGHMLTESNRVKYNADFAVMNSGGIRAPIDRGDISYRDVLTVQPFGNTVTLNTLTGAEIADYLGVVATKQVGAGAYAQIKNVKMTVNCASETVDISEINGQVFDPTETYTFTVPSYVASGGDGYPPLENNVDNGDTDAEVLYDFLKAKQVITATDYIPVAGDVVYRDSESQEGCLISTNP